ncbi:unnamed protein product [Chrysoparadoxa australica]
MIAISWSLLWLALAKPALSFVPSCSTMGVPHELVAAVDSIRRGVPHPLYAGLALYQSASEDDISSLANPDNVSLEAFQDALSLHQALSTMTEPYLGASVAASLNVYEDALRLYGPEKLISSYNGGKDAVVIMHLHRAAVAKHSLDHGRIYRPRVIYFDGAKEFPDVRQLVQDTAKQYDLELLIYKQGFVDGLRTCMEDLGGGSFGFVLGTRKGDPNCGVQTSFTPSSDWMPPFMRVNPIIDWDYGQIWKMIREMDLPYPALYDEGFTSLGGVHDTHPNPALRLADHDEATDGAGGRARLALIPRYLPAYMLSDWSLERAGRDARESSTAGCDLRDFTSKRRKVREAKTAGLVIIGDEILKGMTQDTNTPFAIKVLRENGIVVGRVAIVSDDKDDIADEVRRQGQKFDVVVTSGGVGPTHDDVTIHAVAMALGQRVRQSEDMVQRIKQQLGLGEEDQLTEAQLKMALLPELSKLRMAPLAKPNMWPILQCENVFILPGVPQFFEQKMQVIAGHFLAGNKKFFVKKVVLSADEFCITKELDEVMLLSTHGLAFQIPLLILTDSMLCFQAVANHPLVSFGSYPYVDRAYKTVITLECEKQELVEEATAALLKSLPSTAVMSVQDGEAPIAPLSKY